MSWKGAVKVAVNLNFGALKVSGGAVILAQSSREGLAGPGNPDSISHLAAGWFAPVSIVSLNCVVVA
jgi:hypothetical protein